MIEDHWARYYRGGRLVTGPAGADGGYDQEIRAAWLDFFAGLPDNACVLDLGTGNGAIALLAHEHAAANGKKWAIHGTDRAAIDPRRYAQTAAQRFGSVQFHAGVAAESLPFEAASIDAICAQYALEYTDRAASLDELARVLRGGGMAQLVMHHADSVLVVNARQTLGAIAWLQERSAYGLLRGERCGSSQAVDEMLVELRQRIDMTPEDPGSATLQVSWDALTRLRALRRQFDPQRWNQELVRAQTELEDAQLRLEELCRCALSASAMDALSSSLGLRGLLIDPPSLLRHAGHHLVGWQLRLRKP